MRACPDCGLKEERIIRDGREFVNLEPVSGRCVKCLIGRSKGGKPMPDPDYDWKIEQANDGD